jgi:hypothetical protein
MVPRRCPRLGGHPQPHGTLAVADDGVPQPLVVYGNPSPPTRKPGVPFEGLELSHPTLHWARVRHSCELRQDAGPSVAGHGHRRASPRWTLPTCIVISITPPSYTHRVPPAADLACTRLRPGRPFHESQNGCAQVRPRTRHPVGGPVTPAGREHEEATRGQ